ncbi:G-type lectin S-receptor-like serine/threonine-protein kinase At1g11410 [Macadamia integrifolia]|uniref:G-type lectin S-receptor-like serine/threonine-protein kinase At1g11410 n=1 Tax=Macadamia integrifolia TaxID=60698 RepID=UPI001C4FE20D|nr:G-type lectin S-receptor-like serine/threonine-protein kinase At1g11410 [Macadamia integrifolia]
MLNYAQSGAIKKRQRQRSFLFDFKTGTRCNKKYSGMNGLENNETKSELPFIEVDVPAATDNFSPNNKLGEGGFGAIYKGCLFNGKKIADKRLSSHSGQGMEEFKTEVLLIAKLQHRNLVKLLACSLEEEEKMLIYEYMPNKSLDFFIFGMFLSIPP